MPTIVKSRQETFSDDDTVSDVPSIISNDDNCQATDSMHVIETSELVGRSFLMSTSEDIQHLRVKIVKALCSHQDDLNSNPALKEFIVTSKENTIKEIMRHNEILDFIQNQDDKDQIECHFKRVTSYEGSLPGNHPNCKISL